PLVQLEISELHYHELLKTLEARNKEQAQLLREAQRTAKRKSRQGATLMLIALPVSFYTGGLVAGFLKDMGFNALGIAVGKGLTMGLTRSTIQGGNILRSALESAAFSAVNFGVEGLPGLAEVPEISKEIVKGASTGALQTALHKGNLFENMAIAGIAAGTAAALLPNANPGQELPLNEAVGRALVDSGVTTIARQGSSDELLLNVGSSALGASLGTLLAKAGEKQGASLATRIKEPPLYLSAHSQRTAKEQAEYEAIFSEKAEGQRKVPPKNKPVRPAPKLTPIEEEKESLGPRRKAAQSSAQPLANEPLMEIFSRPKPLLTMEALVEGVLNGDILPGQPRIALVEPEPNIWEKGANKVKDFIKAYEANLNEARQGLEPLYKQHPHLRKNDYYYQAGIERGQAAKDALGLAVNLMPKDNLDAAVDGFALIGGHYFFKKAAPFVIRKAPQLFLAAMEGMAKLKPGAQIKGAQAAIKAPRLQAGKVSAEFLKKGNLPALGLALLGGQAIQKIAEHNPTFNFGKHAKDYNPDGFPVHLPDFKPYVSPIPEHKNESVQAGGFQVHPELLNNKYVTPVSDNAHPKAPMPGFMPLYDNKVNIMERNKHNAGNEKQAIEWSSKGRLKAAQLPVEGRIRFVPRDDYHPSMPLHKGENGGYIDKFGNEWKKGPSRTVGQEFEWDVQLSKLGRKHLGWASRDGKHVNVSLDGHITHK
ncbi:MAG: putative MafB-related protein, partial [Francisellaceae bacterium]|nr:putative MafB-related protein [Francisellaceae bacterium]